MRPYTLQDMIAPFQRIQPAIKRLQPAPQAKDDAKPSLVMTNAENDRALHLSATTSLSFEEARKKVLLSRKGAQRNAPGPSHAAAAAPSAARLSTDVTPRHTDPLPAVPSSPLGSPREEAPRTAFRVTL